MLKETKERKCEFCLERGKDWQGDNPICAYRYGNKFSVINWNCALLNKLRDATDEKGEIYRQDDENIGVLWLGNTKFLMLQWYKDRGKTDKAQVVCLTTKSITDLKYKEAKSIIHKFI